MFDFLKKPLMKRAVGITYSGKTVIQFQADEQYARMFEEFGDLSRAVYQKDGWTLVVDARYDMADVLEHIKLFDLPQIVVEALLGM